MIKNVKYILTTHSLEKMPADDIKEVIIVGKSNVGKSSLINRITNTKKLAYISQKPGKTKALSFFNVDDKFRIVDIPGYGYSNVSKKQLEIFTEMIESFFVQRTNIFHCIILLDVTRKISEDDITMIEYLIYLKIPFTLVGTKLDKASQSKKHAFISECKKVFETEPIMVSSTKNININKLEDIINNLI